MFRIFKVLKKSLSPLPLIMVVSFVGSLVVWFFGEKLRWKSFQPFAEGDMRFWVALCLLVLGLVLMTVMIVRAVRARLASREKKERREPTLEELEAEAMDTAFAKAVAVIRSRWSRGGRSIYGLPWFLVLGKHAAGKTSIIENGDMRFPIDHEIRAELATLGERDAKEFITWRVAGNEAVLLDIDGHQFVPHEERTGVQSVLWDRFLTNLQKIRPRRPINGVILAVDMLEFSHFSMASREEYANLVRRTVNDLVERLGTRLTVHIVFTKMDQLAGFTGFFEGLRAVDRENLFGFHFLYEGRHTPAWDEQFVEQYAEFCKKIHRLTTRQLLDQKTPRNRREAFTFYRTLLGLEAPMSAFLKGALTADKFSTPPLVRGVYFASNRQENAPQNVFLEAVGQRYMLPQPLYGTSQGASYPFFITQFFKKAVFPEAGLSGNNVKVEKRYRSRLMLAFFGSAAACVIGAIYWSAQYNKNLALAENVLERTEVYASLGQSVRNDPTGQQLLDPLNTIRDATFEFDDFREVSAATAQLTLYQGREIGPIADAAYRTILNDQFAPVLLGGVEQKLRQVCPKGSDEELEYLRVYRMMGELEGRDNRVIDKYFGDFWQTNFEAQGEVQEQLNSHLDYMLEKVPAAYETDPALVLSAQENLGRLTPYRRVYANLRALSERQLPNPIEFQSSIGASFGIVYQASTVGEVSTEEAEEAKAEDSTSVTPECGQISEQVFARGPFEVPRIFTAPEYKAFFVPQVERVAQIAADDLWVLGQLESTNYSDEDFLEIQRNLREVYVDDYVRTWRQSLNALEVRDFDDIRDATESLRALSGPDNPIRRIARLVVNNSTIYEPEGEILEGTEASANELPIEPNRAAGLQIFENFSEIRGMLEARGEGGESNMDQIGEALASLYDYMKSVRDAPEPSVRALELSIQRAELTGEDPIYVLSRIAERAPAPFNTHLRHVADEAWRVIMVGATEELNRKWHEEIYGDYQRLIAGRYPFDRESDQDLPVEDFEEFFRPGGILESFYQQELLVFVDETTGEPRIIDGQSLAVDAEFAGSLRSAIDITRSFFDASGDLSIEFSVATAGMSANLSRAVLNFEGQVVINTHGPSRPITIIWPNAIDQSPSSRIDISPLAGTGSTVSRQYNGPWSWLRLYDSASKSNLDNNSVDLYFGNANGQTATFRLRPEARINPFFNSPLSSFELPSHLRSAPEG